jgi:hypothetical protein
MLFLNPSERLMSGVMCMRTVPSCTEHSAVLDLRLYHSTIMVYCKTTLFFEVVQNVDMLDLLIYWDHPTWCCDATSLVSH